MSESPRKPEKEKRPPEPPQPHELTDKDLKEISGGGGTLPHFDLDANA
jgi:bacteriocin-like protein